MRIMHAMCWTDFIFICELSIFQTLQKKDLQSCHGFHYILFNSSTSWQIRHRFKFRSKSHVCDDRKVILKTSHTRAEQNENSAVAFCPLFLTPWAVPRNASHWECEVTALMVAAEFPVFMWVVRCLERPVDLGPMTDELLPRTWMPGCSSLLTSPPGSWSSSSLLLFFCSS